MGNNGNQEPTGCDYNKRQLTCDFSQWDPPLSDGDISNSDLVHSVVVEDVDGAIPTQAFSGLDGPKVRQEETFIEFDCSLQDIHLGVNTFTSNLDWVESLYIKVCYIQSGLPSNVFQELSGLTKLEIAGGGIPESIHTDSLAGLNSLTDLIITASFPDNTLDSGFLSEIINVENVDFKTSGLTNISEGAFAGLYYIKTLDLSSNALTTLPDGLLDTMIYLESLDLSANSLTTLPQGLFDSLVSMTTLDTSENAITSLPEGLLASLESLQNLDLSDNTLQTLPAGFFNSSVALLTIDLSRNSLYYLPDDLFRFQVNLQTLDLSDNALTTLPDNLFNPLISLSSVTLTGNQWDCTCDLYWLSLWSLFTGIEISVDCSTPSVYDNTVLDRAVLSLECQSSMLVNDVTGEATEATQTTTFSAKESSSVDSSDDEALSQWEIITLAISGTSILMSCLTILGVCVAYNKLSSELSRSLSPEPFAYESNEYSTKSSRGRKMFSRTSVHSTNSTEVRPYYDVHYNRKF